MKIYEIPVERDAISERVVCRLIYASERKREIERGVIRSSPSLIQFLKPNETRNTLIDTSGLKEEQRLTER